MKVYRITLAKFSTGLYASGFVARWNSKGTFVIYTAGSRSLACLENLVHRSGEGLDGGFRVMTIEIPDDLAIDRVVLNDLPVNWKEFSQRVSTRVMGDKWVANGKAAVLKVPSAIITEEFNYILNANHREFNRIKLISSDEFSFDRRL
ncbi:MULTISPECIES: RES family NAD+ phosphorylase [unclassified Imperialibacter]|uniref:RES family NAD+ phosphorylase n=1 Tax=unclassified Imperialibacter TaxID=2629706 RepID=UPI001251BC76|nr:MULTISPECIES: RES family NAD+ phosphorylase [unclassified Imperialibacter]CAD5279149.1 RES domain-containing protein [Imperialibacter sp. 89]CAD5293211.1 RES domain-containing protein [Imperialibacter sp. 75]VVS99013.1 RES domain-containing protein [Imperialibacter sp. EC-SDR9]